MKNKYESITSGNSSAMCSPMKSYPATTFNPTSTSNKTKASTNYLLSPAPFTGGRTSLNIDKYLASPPMTIDKILNKAGIQNIDLIESPLTSPQ